MTTIPYVITSRMIKLLKNKIQVQKQKENIYEIRKKKREEEEKRLAVKLKLRKMRFDKQIGNQHSITW